MAIDYKEIVRKLFIKANADGTTPEEKKALEAKAFDIMSHRGITVTIQDKDEKNKSSHYPVSFDGVWVSRQASLFNVISRHFNCTLIDATNNYRHNTYYIFGFESDIDSTQFLYAIVENQMLAELAKLKVPAGRSTKSYRNAWLHGYIISVKERLSASKKSAEKEAAPGYGIALRDKSLAVQDELKSMFPRTKTTQRYYRGSDAFSEGKEAGKKAQFSVNDSVNNAGRMQLS